MLRDEPRWQTHFGQWVTDVGVEPLAARLSARLQYRVTESAVYGWVSGYHAPRPPIALAMVALSGGEISLSDIYGQAFEVRR